MIPDTNEGPPSNALLPPPPVTRTVFETFVLQTGWFIIVFPDTDLHRPLARKLAEQKPGQLLPLTPDELALLQEFLPWPPRSA